MVINSEKLALKCFDFSFMLYLIAFQVFNTASTFNDIFRMASTIALMIFGLMVCINRRYSARFLRGYTIWYLIFSLYALASASWAIKSSNVLGLFPAFIRIIIISHFITVRIESLDEFSHIFVAYIAMTMYYGTYVLVKAIKHFGVHSFYLERLGLYDGFNPNAIAICLVLSLILLIYIRNGSTKKYVRILSMICMIYMLFLLIITGSKKGIIGLILAFVIFKLLFSSLTDKVKHILSGILFMILMWELVENIPILYNVLGYRLESMLGIFTNKADGSTANRMALIKTAINIWLDNPVLGIGLNNFSLVQTVGGSGYYSHNNYVELLADLGCVGFITYYLFPLRLIFSKTTVNPEIMSLKTICIIILFWDLALVSYQEIGIQIFILMFSLCAQISRKTGDFCI